MSRSLSWIDPDSVSAALSRARGAPGPKTGQLEPPRFDAPRASPEASPTTAPVATPSFGAQTPLAERLQAFASWVESEIGPERWYIADEEGLPLHVAGTSETQVLSGVMLARALRPLRAVLGPEPVQAATLALAGGRVLHTIWSETSTGRLVLGLESPRRADEDSLRTAADLLRRALES